ncbi:DDE-type integrase/transposase/recombinase [Aduncisulcus paluster]|uniref:DDE-type integrase/transposase/recombinase n=1 Tax=Aduncisulcus paluster TaxID=2918883 RepID=A0ABQ5K9G3_9EUKA|nr:DDE-type integrase/transposase/recombinase [Aduncisulcus paluster]
MVTTIVHLGLTALQKDDIRCIHSNFLDPSLCNSLSFGLIAWKWYVKTRFSLYQLFLDFPRDQTDPKCEPQHALAPWASFFESSHNVHFSFSPMQQLPLSCRQQGVRKIEYLGMELNEKGQTVAKSRLQGIKDIVDPRNKKELRTLLGFLGYFRKFIRNYATTINPLMMLMAKKQRFCWEAPQKEALAKIRQALLQRPMLSQIDYKKRIILRTDASDIGAGGVLLQKDDSGEEEHILYVSKAFRGAQLNWPTIEKECFAIFYCLDKVSKYIRGMPFTIETDHRNLIYMRTSKNSKVRRWAMAIQEFQFDLVHVAGEKNVIADTLSRLVHVRRTVVDRPNLLEICKEAQKSITDQERELLYEEDGFFYTKKGDNIFIPALEFEAKEGIIRLHHNATVGHGGITQTSTKILDSGISWARLFTDVKEFVKKLKVSQCSIYRPDCPVCQKIKAVKPEKATPLSIHRGTPFHTFSVDTIGPLDEDKDGYKCIIVAVDNFTRFVELAPLKTATSNEAADAIIRMIIARYGVPKCITTDGGPQYSNYLSDHLYDTLTVKHHITTKHHHQSNGMVERVNKEVEKHLQALLIEIGTLDRWNIYIPLVQSIINNTPHSSTGATPNELLYGKTLPKSVIKDWTKELEKSERELPERKEEELEYVSSLTDNIRKLQRRSRQYQRRKMEKDSEGKQRSFNTGDYVLLKRDIGVTKLIPAFTGPYKVILQIADKLYKLQSMTCDSLTVEAEIDKMIEFIRDPKLSEKDIRALALRDYGSRLIERIEKHRGKKGNREFLVKWYGLKESRNNWISYKEIKSLAILKEYLKVHRIRNP